MALPDSEAFNVEFVQTIETHRCLYDVNLQAYSSKEEQDKAWNLIARKFSSSGAECKKRWKHLRGGLTRYYKRLRRTSGEAAKKIKPFYLWDVMHFVIPFLKSRDRSRRLPPPLCFANDQNEEPEAFKIEAETDSEAELAADDSIDTSRDASETPDTACATLEAEPAAPYKRARHETSTATADDYFERTLTPAYSAAAVAAHARKLSDDPDLDFFRSILPDMAHLNASQKRRFKIRVLQLLDEIATDGTGFSHPGALSNSSTGYVS